MTQRPDAGIPQIPPTPAKITFTSATVGEPPVRPLSPPKFEQKPVERVETSPSQITGTL